MRVAVIRSTDKEPAIDEHRISINQVSHSISGHLLEKKPKLEPKLVHDRQRGTNDQDR